MSNRRFRTVPTAMADAFLDALFDKMKRGTPTSNKAVIPVGVVDTNELRRVLTALVCAGRDRIPSNNQNRRRASR
jgi:hypothetical protein